MTPLLLALLAATSSAAIDGSSVEPADPCAPIAARSPPDPELARTYAEVGRSELARSDPQAAAVALRRAAELDPGDPTLRRDLAALCQQGDAAPRALLAEAVALAEAGDFRASLARIERVRAGVAGAGRLGPELALVAALNRVELGDDDEARAELQHAATSTTVGELARLLLAVVAFREGRSVEGAELLAPLTRSPAPGTARAALEIERFLGRRLGRRLTLAAGVDLVADTNPGLSPDNVAPPVQLLARQDTAIRGALAAHFTPVEGQIAPYADVAFAYQKQRLLDVLDLGTLDGVAGVKLGEDALGGAIEYLFEYQAQGGSRYAFAHDVGAHAHYARRGLRLSAGYLARFESFLATGTSGYSGLVQVVQLESAFDLSALLWLQIRYELFRDGTDDSANTYDGHGPRVRFSVWPQDWLRTAAEADLSFRYFDPASAVTGTVRQDTQVDALVSADLFLGAGVSLRIDGVYRRVFSTINAEGYDRLIATVGVRYEVGVW